jgi:hypothetical protein
VGRAPESAGGPQRSTRTVTPAWEISDWSVKATGRHGKAGVEWCIEKVLLHARDTWLRYHYFPSSEHLFASEPYPSARPRETPGLGRSRNLGPSPDRFFCEFSLVEAEAAVSLVCQGPVVGDHQDGGVVVPPEGAEELDDVVAGLLVQVAGGLIGQDELRFVGKRPGNGNALLFAAGKSGRLARLAPFTTTSPLVGLSSAPSRDSRVLLPLPLLPTIEASVPCSRTKLTSLTGLMVRSPELKVRTRFLTSIMAILLAGLRWDGCVL